MTATIPRSSRSVLRRFRRRLKQQSVSTGSTVDVRIPSSRAANVSRLLTFPSTKPKSGFVLEESASQLSIELIHEVSFRDRAIRFTRPVPCLVRFTGGTWCHEIPALGFSGYGRSELESLESLSADIMACWDDIALAKDDDLSLDARDFKKRLKSAMKELA